MIFELCPSNQADGFWKCFAFRLKDFGSKGFRSIDVEHIHHFLDDDRAGVVGAIGKVNGASGIFDARFNRGFMHCSTKIPTTAKCRNQRWMDIQNPSLVIVGDEEKGQESAQYDHIGLGISDFVEDQLAHLQVFA